jgi:hypothetical protein
MPLRDVPELPFDEYLLFLREARIWNLSQTKDGQEYLYNAWRIMQTKSDREAIKRYKERVSEGAKK